MRKLMVREFVSLDGVMQAPGGTEEDLDGGFKHGGWTMPYWQDDMGPQLLKLMENADAFLLGRKTWQIHGTAFDPMPAGDPFVDVFNGLPKYVVSTTIKSTDLWRNSTIIGSDVVETVRKLKQLPGKNILMDGSSVLVQTLLENDLVDEIYLHIYPLVLGNGKRIFPPGKRINFSLVESSPLPTGVVYCHYRKNSE
jgi:dihydrofolate reductase